MTPQYTSFLASMVIQWCQSLGQWLGSRLLNSSSDFTTCMFDSINARSRPPLAFSEWSIIYFSCVGFLQSLPVMGQVWGDDFYGLTSENASCLVWLQYLEQACGVRIPHCCTCEGWALWHGVDIKMGSFHKSSGLICLYFAFPSANMLMKFK